MADKLTETVTLTECPIGLFWHGDTLCLKTEYGNNEGRIDAYIVESGEFYWGDAPQTIASQRAQKVVPVDTGFALAALSRVDEMRKALEMAKPKCCLGATAIDCGTPYARGMEEAPCCVVRAALGSAS